MATLAMLQDNDAVHSLPPFANEENKALSEKVTQRILTWGDNLKPNTIDQTNGIQIECHQQ
jgi:hypothetical protein